MHKAIYDRSAAAARKLILISAIPPPWEHISRQLWITADNMTKMKDSWRDR